MLPTDRYFALFPELNQFRWSLIFGNQEDDGVSVSDVFLILNDIADFNAVITLITSPDRRLSSWRFTKRQYLKKRVTDTFPLQRVHLTQRNTPWLGQFGNPSTTAFTSDIKDYIVVQFSNGSVMVIHQPAAKQFR